MAAGFAVLVGCLVLIGWWLDLRWVSQLSAVSMNPLTAITFILAGWSLWLLKLQDTGSTAYRCGRVLAFSIVVIGVLKLLDLVLNLQLNFDRILFADKLDFVDSVPNRMAPNTGAAFVLLGLALATMDDRKHPWLSAISGLLLLLFSLVALIGYAYSMNALYSIAAYIPMALHTAIVFAVLSLGVLLARPQSPFMRVVTNDSIAGIMARRLLPAAVIVPVVLGWLRLLGERVGLYPLEVGAGLFAIGIIVIFVVVVWYTARLLLMIDSARLQAQAEITKLNRELTIANKELEAFSYSVSHDLRAPLRAVNGFSRIVLDEYSAELSPPAVRYLRLISDNGAQMGRLIDDLLAFSRLSRQPLQQQTLQMALLAQQVFDELKGDDTRAVEFIVQAMPTAQADAALIKQVYVNLIGNALKYSSKRDAPRIEVGCEWQNSVPVYYVRDNGVGFDMKYADKLFTVFQRLHTAEEFEGTGVGLAIAQRIVHRHGGRIWADAAVNQGASFYFSLGDGYGTDAH
jgi:signal transduction histidine kinase